MTHPVLSSLAKSVFDQTPCPFTVDWAWWIEQRLQIMKINGLVKMINQSAKIDQDYIDGYMPKYRWAFREYVVDISKCDWWFGIIQVLQGTFAWSMWNEIVKIPMNDIDMVHSAILKSINCSNYHVAYAMSIYWSERTAIEAKVAEAQPTITNSDIQTEIYQVSETTKSKWSEIRNKL